MQFEKKILFRISKSSKHLRRLFFHFFIIRSTSKTFLFYQRFKAEPIYSFSCLLHLQIWPLFIAQEARAVEYNDSPSVEG